MIKKYLKFIIIAGAVALVAGGGVFLAKHLVAQKNNKIETREPISISQSSVNTEDVAIIAHRGLSAAAPENTAHSIRAAVKAGINLVEFDISESRDGTPVLMHDDTVNRMTDGTGKVKNFTYYELLKMKFDNGANLEKYGDVRITSAEEALEICDSSMVVPVLDIKDISEECEKRLFEMIEDKALPTIPIIISFDGERLVKLKKQYPDYKYMYLVSQITDESIKFCNDNGLGIDFNANNNKNSDEDIKKLAESDMQVACWTVDDIEQFEKLVNLGVKLITSNVLVP